MGLALKAWALKREGASYSWGGMKSKLEGLPNIILIPQFRCDGIMSLRTHILRSEMQGKLLYEGLGSTLYPTSMSCAWF